MSLQHQLHDFPMTLVMPEVVIIDTITASCSLQHLKNGSKKNM